MKKNQNGIGILKTLLIFAIVVLLLLFAVKYYQGTRANVRYDVMASHADDSNQKICQS